VVESGLETLMAAGALLRGEFRPGGVEREWCDPEVLRQLRRRSLARLRREIEPVEPAALARFLPGWHGIGGRAGGLDRLIEVIGQLEGLPIAASVLERDVLPARVRGYAPAMLDELGAAGEVVWAGAGSLGRDDGRVALYRPDRLALLRGIAAPDGAGEQPDGWIGAALLERLAERGAAFYRELWAGVLEASTLAGRGRPTERMVLDALWDLVWAGEVTNDTFAPLRALQWPRTGRSRRAPRARLGAAMRLGPPEAAGRWSLVEETVRTATALSGGQAPSETERRAAQATALLERHGVLTRDAVASEGVTGGFGAVYPILRAMEERGRVRRGYFVEGLGGAQFALSGAVDRLRSTRQGADDVGPGSRSGDTVLLAATDPANPYGAALPWPRDEGRGARTPARTAGAYVVIDAGRLVLYLERGARSLLTFGPFDEEETAARAVAVLGTLVADGRLRTLQVERIDGAPAASSSLRPRFDVLGFRPAYRGLVLATRGPSAIRANG
jgi:ATP-dependent Lhr-like helicase